MGAASSKLRSDEAPSNAALSATLKSKSADVPNLLEAFTTAVMFAASPTDLKSVDPSDPDFATHLTLPNTSPAVILDTSPGSNPNSSGFSRANKILS